MPKEDFEFFKQEMADVKPLQQKKTTATGAPAAGEQAPTEAQLARREAAVRENLRDPNILTMDYIEQVGPHDLLSFKRPGIQEGVFRKLRLGKYPNEATLDLHRKSMQEARAEVFDFIEQCMKHDLRSVMILHGKGERSNPPALLKSCVNKWLPMLEPVMAFHSAQLQHGGSGAVYVLLRKSDQQKMQNRIKHSKGRV